jgi:hypothetical protein
MGGVSRSDHRPPASREMHLVAALVDVEHVAKQRLSRIGDQRRSEQRVDAGIDLARIPSVAPSLANRQRGVQLSPAVSACCS